jgi:hypothetical protein
MVTVVLCGLLTSAALAGPLPDRFTLGRYLPADVWLYVHFVRNPERSWLEKEWQEVFDALKTSGIDQDVASLFLSAMGDEKRTEVEATLDKWTMLIQAVRWGDLIHEEAAFAERLGSGKAPADYFLLARGKAGSAEGNMAAIVAILKELAALGDKVNLANRELNGVTVWSLALGDVKHMDFSFSLEVFRKGEVIGFASGRGPVEEVVALIAGKTEKRSVVGARRFAQAIATAKPPEDSLAFFDMKALMAGLGNLMDKATAHAGSDDEGHDEGLKIVGVIKKAMTLFDVVDYTLVTVETEGRRELAHQVTRLQPGKQKNSMASCCLNRKPFKRFDRFIPAGATGFSLSGMINLEELYKVVIAFVRDEVPEGAKYIATWNGVLASIGFDPARDLFSWWSGEMISVTLPPAVVTPMSGADWVVMFRVKDTEIASQKINTAIDFVSGKLQAQGQMLMISPASVSAEGFRQVTHPMAMMFLRPVIGVKDDWLVIGSSADPVNKCLAVDAGKAPSIVTSERFKKEGLIPEGPVLSASFKDTSRFGEELGQAAAMAGMIGGMVTAMIPDEPEARKVKQVVQKAMGIIMKLGPVLQKMDFYSSESAVTTYDGELTVRTEKVITYKPAASDEVKTAQAE